MRITGATRTILLTFVLLTLGGGCANNNIPPVRPALSTLDSNLSRFEAPSCGARIYVIMGVNHKFPTVENLRIPQGLLFLNGALVDNVSSSPEISALDVPPGRIDLSWMPALFGEYDRNITKQNVLSIDVADNQAVFVSLEFFDDTSGAATFLGPLGAVAGHSVRTEVMAANRANFVGKRIVFHRTSPNGCDLDASASRSPSRGGQILSPAITSETNTYIVNASNGAPAFAVKDASGAPIHTFQHGSRLNVVEVSSDRSWLKVLTPDGRISYVPASIVAKPSP